MQNYTNLRGNSPIIGYEIEPTRIRIMFKGGEEPIRIAMQVQEKIMLSK